MAAKVMVGRRKVATRRKREKKKVTETGSRGRGSGQLCQRGEVEEGEGRRKRVVAAKLLTAHTPTRRMVAVVRVMWW